PHAPAAAVAEGPDGRVPRAGADRPAPPARTRTVRHVGSPGGLLVQGLPLRAGPGDVAGARERTRDAVRHPRLDGLLARPAHPVLVVDPGRQPRAGVLQRRRAAPADAAGPADACGALPD